ncbi:hypothetical protein GHK92_00995 [Nocardioides sp. dk4132]|uniref:hypothetical protein n=1 Tax=unclassified Nocardioides TaxID=2615069 RepID=UPI001297DA6D|nr:MULTISPECIES: hypothetical protein [unclassified Nocardioides]MQW74443.1 hypothetical protein [Nocardioides sp. dk4132]QGA06377.1 hypothetical protein GFH29_02440 [Nocardioides sp. dk884]
MSSRPAPLAPRGPLPAAVYWRRRLVLLVALVVVVAVLVQLIGGGDGDQSEPKASAALSAAETTPETAASAGPSSEPSQATRVKKRKRPALPVEPVLAEPSGPCVDSDVAVAPEVGTAIAGQGADIVLSLRTLTAEACTWTVAPRTLSVKITSGDDDIWFSQHCPVAIPSQDVTVRRAVSTPITLEWNARRSDEDCSAQAGWAMPGFYHVTAAALGGEPDDVQFELVLAGGSAAQGRPQVTGRPRAEQQDDDRS